MGRKGHARKGRLDPRFTTVGWGRRKVAEELEGGVERWENSQRPCKMVFLREVACGGSHL